MNTWVRFTLVSISLLCGACKYSTPMIGFISTEPGSIPAIAPSFGTLRIDVSAVVDTMKLSAPGHTSYMVHDVRQTAQHALLQAFRSTFPDGVTVTNDSEKYALHLLSLRSDYRPLGYYKHTEYKESPFSFGPRMSSTTTSHAPYSINTEYRASLYMSDSLIATFDNVLESPGIWDMQTNLKKGMERMAEDLNARVVRFVLGQKEE